MTSLGHKGRVDVEGQERRAREEPRRGMPPAKDAFTLLEVLLTASIVSLCAAIVVPSLDRARQQSRELLCAANLRSWGQVFQLYADASHSTLPHTDDRSRNRTPYAYDPAHSEHECCYIDLLPPLMQRPSWRDITAGVKPGGDIWQCPAAAALPDSAYTPRFKPSIVGYHSYAMNSYLEYDFPFGESPQMKPLPSFLRLDRCLTPAKTILMFEQTLNPREGYGQEGGFTEAGWHTAEDARALSERHDHARGGLGGNILLIDGHADWKSKLWDRTLANPRLPPRYDRTWFPY
jgi:prepilin-type N-terminal cleavage/methylation domain-containing protein